MTASPPPTPSFDPHNLPELKDANEHIANEPGTLGKLFNRLMMSEDEEVAH